MIRNRFFFRVCNKLPNWHLKNQAQIDTASERISSHFVLTFDKDHDMRLSLHLTPQLINNAYIVHYILSRQPPNSFTKCAEYVLSDLTENLLQSKERQKYSAEKNLWKILLAWEKVSCEFIKGLAPLWNSVLFVLICQFLQS